MSMSGAMWRHEMDNVIKLPVKPLLERLINLIAQDGGPPNSPVVPPRPRWDNVIVFEWAKDRLRPSNREVA